MPLLFLCGLLLLAGAQAKAAPAPAKLACPSTVLLESTNGKYYVIVFGSPVATASTFDMQFFSKGGAFHISTPTAVPILHASALAGRPFRSTPMLVSNPGSDPFLGATIQSNVVHDNVRCAGENIIIPSPDSFTSPDRHVDAQTAALEDQVAGETGAAATALVPVAAPSATPLSCDVPFADATVDQVDTPGIPAGVSPGDLTDAAVKVDLAATGSITAAIVTESSGNPDVDAAAIASARKATYHPAIFACQAQKSSHVIRFDFTK
jgi:TonB family protein